jgi:hypothetical protein
LEIRLTDGEAIRGTHLYLRGTIDGNSVDVPFTGDGIFSELPEQYSVDGLHAFNENDDKIQSGQGVKIVADESPIESVDIDLVWDSGYDSTTLASLDSDRIYGQTFDFEYTKLAGSSNTLTITKTEGEPIPPAEVFIWGNIDDNFVLFEFVHDEHSQSYSVNGVGGFDRDNSDQLTNGEGIEIVDDGLPLDSDDLTVEWDSAVGSFELATDSS